MAPHRNDKVGAGIVGPSSFFLAAVLCTVGGEREVFTDSSLSLGHSRKLRDGMGVGVGRHPWCSLVR